MRRRESSLTTATHVIVIATVKAEARFGQEGICLLRLGGLSVGKRPAWFRRIVERDFGGHFSADWFDHHARAGDALVVEPYGLCHEDLRDLLAFAGKYGLSVSISATSQHFPTRTLAVFLTPREEARAA
jgi:hypothetical protein